VHETIGHLGIFVSGKVAKKEYTQIVEVLQTIERLPPGLYGMHITERKGEGGRIEYEVEFREHRLEDIMARFNRFERADEKPFEAVEALSEFNQRAYEMFAQPLVQSLSNDYQARVLQQFHPLRMQHWMLSSLNPWLAWLPAAATQVGAHRQPQDDQQPLRQLEHVGSELISASLDYYRAMRDAITESSFFGVYANMFSMYLADKHQAEASKLKHISEPRELPFVKEALASIAQGGYPEAFARVAFLVSRKGEPLPLARLQLTDEVAADYADYLPKMPPEQLRRVRGEQEIIARYEPEQAVLTLPVLLSDRADRQRLLTLLDKLLADSRVLSVQPTNEQLAAVERIRLVLGGPHMLERRISILSAAPKMERRVAAARA
jgi:hypothetical protein